MRKLIAIAALLGLAACGPTPEERRAVQEQLPEGCTIHDLGEYGRYSHLTAIICNGRPTTSLNFRRPQGKNSVPAAVFTIGQRT